MIINEVDSDTNGTDTLEFVELYDGGVEFTHLDGLVVVFYDGSGDTSYAGIAVRKDGKALVSWYSGRLDKDEIWLLGMINVTNIWHGVIDFSKVK